MRVAWRTVGSIIDRVWANTEATPRGFFGALDASGDGRGAYVSVDGADSIGDVVAEYCPNAVRAADPFHVVSWPLTS